MSPGGLLALEGSNPTGREFLSFSRKPSRVSAQSLATLLVVAAKAFSSGVDSRRRDRISVSSKARFRL
jgi:hypothetical protein